MLTRFKPSIEVDRFPVRTDWNLPSLLRDFFSETANGDGNWPTLRLPRTNVMETEKEYVFTLEMPGMSRSDVEVNVENDVLVVKGARESKSEEAGVVRREFFDSRFERSFGLGRNVDSAAVTARMENGILTVTLPKKAEAVGRRVDIS